jgi:hypothetical protein
MESSIYATPPPDLNPLNLISQKRNCFIVGIVGSGLFRPNTDPSYLRQMGIICDQHDLLELLKTSRFGRCVYRCDNNVVDH